MFVDEANILVKAGRGGSGCVSMHREKFQPKGGPDGGDGGRGGSVVLFGDEGLKTLIDFQWRRQYKAASGTHGQGSNRHGRSGRDLLLRVPIGTIARVIEGEIIGEVLTHGERLVICKGGLGGRGNAHFATAYRKAPAFAEKGEPGEEKSVHLELKLLADVGLVGFPNCGKSTLISRVSAAKPKIADYPFTTLKPNLGVVRLDDERTFVMADVPGLIEGAHRGKGLGDRFLRHLERTVVLLHLLDMSGFERPDPLEDYDKIRRELVGFGGGLEARPEIIVGTKVDLEQSADNVKRAVKYFKKTGKRFIPISSLTGEGIKELLYATADLVDDVRPEKLPILVDKVRVYSLGRQDEITIEKVSARLWRVKNERIERMVKMTDWVNDEAVDHLRHSLVRLGVEERLEKAGAAVGDDVVIGDMTFDFSTDARDREAPADESASDARRNKSD